MRLSVCHSCLPDAVRRGLLSILVCCGAMSVFLLCPLSHALHVAASDIADLLGSLLTGAWVFWGAYRDTHSPKRARAAAACLGAGVLCYSFGQAVWNYLELVAHRPNPFPSLSDVFFVLAYPCLAAGIFLLPGRPLSRAARGVAALDGLMILTGLVTFSWYFVLGPTLLTPGESLLGKVLGAAYPLGDLLLLACLLVLSARAGGSKTTTGVLASGLLCVVAIDTLFAYKNLHGSYDGGGVCDVLWPLGYMLMAFAGHLAHLPSSAVIVEHATVPRPDPLWRVLLPYVPVPAVATLAFTAMEHQSVSALMAGVYGGAALLIFLVLARQYLAVLENRRLAAELRLFNANLEETVAARTQELHKRTQQLSALLELTAAVHDAPDEAEVVAAVLRHTRMVLRADAILLWLTEGKVKRACLRADGVDDDAQLWREWDAAPPEVDILLLSGTDEQKGGTCLRVAVEDGEHVLGLIGAVRHQGIVGPTDAALLRSVGAEVGRALGNARRLQQAQDAADRDPVTHLFNHRAIHQLLDRELLAAHASDRPLSLMMMDLDNFKLFNDTYGHPVGDEVLRRVASALREECGDHDCAARYGGDEFLVLLPGQDGAEARALARRLQERMAHEALQREEMVTGETRVIPVALSCGVASFPADSFDRHELLSIADANLYAAKNSEDSVRELSAQQRENRSLRTDEGFGVLEAMLTAVDNKDHYTCRHSEDVTEYALWIADEIGLSKAQTHALRIGGLLHDVGKIGVPEDILRKPGRLTPDEYAIMQRHPELGALIVAGVPGMENVVDAVRFHHERWDGAGYPDKLAGELIPLPGRILAVADAVSAMTTDRPYRRGMAWDAAMNIVHEARGTQFDPELADAFLRAAAHRVPAEQQAA